MKIFYLLSNHAHFRNMHSQYGPQHALKVWGGLVQPAGRSYISNTYRPQEFAPSQVHYAHNSNYPIFLPITGRRGIDRTPSITIIVQMYASSTRGARLAKQCEGRGREMASWSFLTLTSIGPGWEEGLSRVYTVAASILLSSSDFPPTEQVSSTEQVQILRESGTAQEQTPRQRMSKATPKLA